MHVHILGICGSFMGGIAAIAKSLGHKVTGSDKNVYPPMSTQLEALGIELTEGYCESQFDPAPDMVVIGNAMSRGNPAVEYVLNRNLPYTSGPQWLLDNLLKDRWVIGLSGTHGKTTTSSMVAWILEHAGLNPGYLIGGVPENFGVSARVGESPFFVIEADEYDSAFFDKRSKFVHYRPKTLVINNLEFDHADIFADLGAIQTQFHHLVRMVPENGLILTPNNTSAIEDMLKKGCWSSRQSLGKEWHAELLKKDGSEFNVLHNGVIAGTVTWALVGQHNVDNALMAIAAAHHAGVTLPDAIDALSFFKNVKRRMEVKGEVNNITLYDDFAHHPTAIATTLDGLRKKVGNARILAVLEPRSNTMKMGVHKDTLANSWQKADEVYLYEPEGMDWSLVDSVAHSNAPTHCFRDVEKIVQGVCNVAQPGDHILVMSNGGFEGIHGRILDALKMKSKL
ncbi:MAG: UDP-N-acetylmuramate:L-alanyl-gamma-D-glutamyl-meso-diaminopimelate ligase [Pseudomonadota bacterium]|jgi:UDP-N-acetylmuramate: L-alanyl-gamma-D-glutamyl-meso-diaminopimelate ligase|uniref:UDP-N-acetylmuramate:L-alanyl-gamma-D-glutamyl- meso-diaminopimelate ligase n=1 Tax=Alteromonas sp. MmMcT2-2 TaxID=2917732 RepID=UPI001EF22326|nr:UDP-N-acetylmuramate:L-alanyl-gamma-D-glutamyl-meso-diaminopimelate ligase [Alteromonas sp. MmMcT2-2]MEC7081109.1 UDP-N-acetylmuramate:L-alanyl-gamma-D-glutamyl-meso-diaminopimelate ligase [Pseudomonadota bacterium]MCG7641448.1 UDP-N-acetylmuramate:L-alanyl-gamma-D-glutamyl-meso-diaminopimelate ligase [Alteromonas sp. MmMcT2-2]MED5378845.1 UDP-N-acetylmuramate:L-alanyl-gamma-D-glutamyl-meso-diaminopimelate ligase [Pseudomonadota bacterium]MED6322771.1 UDP-N-acetylmuramate:L-alanyl-gamma-D-gl